MLFAQQPAILVSILHWLVKLFVLQSYVSEVVFSIAERDVGVCFHIFTSC